MRHLAKILLPLLLVACQSGNAQTAQPGDSSPAESTNTAVVAEAAAKPALPRTIGKGEPVDLMAERDPSRITVFDFTSPYCGPCRQISPYMDKLHAEREDVAVVKVDINRPGVRGIDFYSPTARQHGIMKVPTMMVVDAQGTMIAQGDPAWQLVVKWILEIVEPTGR